MMSWRRQTNATAYEGTLHPAGVRRSRGHLECINRRNPRAAREVKAFVEKRISALGELEIRHHAIPKLGVHALWLRRYPYIVYYRVGRDEIAIVHIRHVAQKPWDGEGD